MLNIDENTQQNIDFIIQDFVLSDPPLLTIQKGKIQKGKK